MILLTERRSAPYKRVIRGTQRHSEFLENICSEHDLRSRIFGTFVVKFLAWIFEHLKNGIIAHFNGFLPLRGHLEFSGAFFLAEIFEKVSLIPYNLRITGLSARKSEQMKNFKEIKICLYLPFKY